MLSVRVLTLVGVTAAYRLRNDIRRTVAPFLTMVSENVASVPRNPDGHDPLLFPVLGPRWSLSLTPAPPKSCSAARHGTAPFPARSCRLCLLGPHHPSPRTKDQGLSRLHHLEGPSDQSLISIDHGEARSDADERGAMHANRRVWPQSGLPWLRQPAIAPGQCLRLVRCDKHWVARLEFAPRFANGGALHARPRPRPGREGICMGVLNTQH